MAEVKDVLGMFGFASGNEKGEAVATSKKGKYALEVYRFANVDACKENGDSCKMKVSVDENGSHKWAVDENGKQQYDKNGKPLFIWYPINKTNKICNEMVAYYGSMQGYSIHDYAYVTSTNGNDEKRAQLQLRLMPNPIPEQIVFNAKFDKGVKKVYEDPVPFTGKFVTKLKQDYKVKEDKSRQYLTESDDFTPVLAKKQDWGFMKQYRGSKCNNTTLPLFDGTLQSLLTQDVLDTFEAWRKSLPYLQYYHIHLFHSATADVYVMIIVEMDKMESKLPLIIEK